LQFLVLPQAGAGGYHDKDAVPGAIWQEKTLNCSSLYCRQQALEVIMTKMLFLVPSGEQKQSGSWHWDRSQVGARFGSWDYSLLRYKRKNSLSVVL